MRITVSLPESLVRKADRFARRLRISRSQLYAEAIAEYLACHAANDITESMNAVCDEIGQADGGFVSSAARCVFEKERKPRRNWERKFSIMAQKGDDKLLDCDATSLTSWDEEEC
jgi:hypothetical protein